MVGGLVEQQHVGGLPGQPGEDDAATLTVGQLLDGGGLERGQIVTWKLWEVIVTRVGNSVEFWPFG